VISAVTKLPGPKDVIGVGERRHHAGRAGIAIEERAYEHDPCRRALASCAERDGDLLPFADRRQIGERHREIDPQFRKIDDDV
jgi:hypothetical protein